MIPELPNTVSFAWDETPKWLAVLRRRGAVGTSADGKRYVAADGGTPSAKLRPPLVLLSSDGLPPPVVLGERAEEGPGRYALLLLQAGAAAVGLFDDDRLLDHKAFKRYVVRGKGRAQPTYLESRGKSRYGSRLRLRNAGRLLEDVSARVGEWFADDVPPERLYVACPVRLYADLCRAEPAFPVPADDPRRVRIPIDVNVPTHAELLRVHRSISRGRVWWSGAPEDDR